MKKFKGMVLGLGLVGFFLAVNGSALDSWVAGKLVSAEVLFQRGMARYINHLTLEENKSALEALGEEKKAVIANFLGQEGIKYLLANCNKGENCSLIKTSFTPTKQISVQEFQKFYPEILATQLNLIPMDKYKSFIIASADDIGPQGVLMDWRGLGKYFKILEPSRHEVILENTPTWLFLEIGLRRYEEIKDYTCIYYKQERLGTKLQGEEKILLKYREKPKGIYMKWLDGPWKDREMVYNELMHKDKVRARESGFLGVVPVWVHYKSALATRGTNHNALEAGLKFTLDLNLRDYKKGTANNELKRVDHGLQELDGKKVYVMENILPKDKNKGYYCYRVIHYMDYADGVEIKTDIYNWDDQLQESFFYSQIKINVGLTDKDFDPENPEYNL